MITSRSLKRLAREAAYRSGALSLVRTRVRNGLTTILLHRVVDPADPDFARADPNFTLSTPVFDQLLEFFSRHYRIITLEEALLAREKSRRLPAHALLITFDDGWADNLRYAAPLLKRRSMPAVVFAAAEPILSPQKSWWQEQVFAIAREGQLDTWVSQQANCHQLQPRGNTPAGALALVVQLGRLPQPEREELLAGLPAIECHARMMLTADELQCLPDNGIAVALHGYSHLPLTELSDIGSDLRKARSAMLDLSNQKALINTLALPHSRYDARVLVNLREIGIKHVFSGDALIERTNVGNMADRQIVGRIRIDGQYMASNNELDPAAAARWLWDRPFP